MTQSNAAQFKQVYLANAAGTLVELTAYVSQAQEKTGNDDTDVTVFAAGGGPVTETHVRGAATSSVSVDFLYDPTLVKTLRQIIGARKGFTAQFIAGSNQAPTQGDEMLYGTYTCLSAVLAYDGGKPATLKCQFDPADAGAITPNFQIY
jgi:hypothetical protein